MSVNSYAQYENVKEKAASGNTARINYFKLAENASCLVRINVGSVTDLAIYTVHKPVFGKQFEGLKNPFAGISCYNEIGNYSGETCPLCKAVTEGHSVIGKADKLIYVQMLVSYLDPTTGRYTPAVPTIWERKANFCKELAGKIANYGDLRSVVFKLSRTGSGVSTRYVLDYVPMLDKEEYVPKDFSGFTDFKPEKVCFYEKGVDEINAYLATGHFNDTEQELAATAQAAAQAVYTAPTQPAYTQPQQPTYVAPAQPTYEAPTQQQPTAQDRPTRNYGRF